MYTYELAAMKKVISKCVRESACWFKYHMKLMSHQKKLK